MKKGSMHIEILIAFMLFVTFVVFLLFFVKPYRETVLPDSIILGLQDSFEFVAASDVTSIFLVADSGAFSCFSIELEGYGVTNASVRGVDGKMISASYDSRFLNINSSGGAFKVVLSRDVQETVLGSCPILPGSNYTFGGVDSMSVLSLITLQELKNEYNNNYDVLRQTFKIPVTYDFAIDFGIPEVGLLKDPYDGAQVFAKSHNYGILYPNGNVEIREVIFKIW